MSRLKKKLLPGGTRRQRLVSLGLSFATTVAREGAWRALAKTKSKVCAKIAAVQTSRRLRLLERMKQGRPGDWGDLGATVSRSNASVDVVICIHNALDDVRLCLDSVVRNLTPVCSIILVDDG